MKWPLLRFCFACELLVCATDPVAMYQPGSGGSWPDTLTIPSLQNVAEDTLLGARGIIHRDNAPELSTHFFVRLPGEGVNFSVTVFRT